MPPKPKGLKASKRAAPFDPPFLPSDSTPSTSTSTSSERTYPLDEDCLTLSDLFELRLTVLEILYPFPTDLTFAHLDPEKLDEARSFLRGILHGCAVLEQYIKQGDYGKVCERNQDGERSDEKVEKRREEAGEEKLGALGLGEDEERFMEAMVLYLQGWSLHHLGELFEDPKEELRSASVKLAGGNKKRKIDLNEPRTKREWLEAGHFKYKINIALEELNALGTPIKYKEHNIDFGKNEQKEPWFLKINPNGRIPCMIDRDNGDLKVWETGSMLRYLSEVYDKNYNLHFDNIEEETEMYNWVYFQHGGYGPMAGQAGHFLNAAPEKIPYAAKRYLEESARLLDVYEKRLAEDGGRDYLVGKEGKGKFSYADIVSFPWIRAHPYSLGLASLDKDYPNIVKWMSRIEAREGTKKAIAGDMVEKIKSKDGWEEEAEKKREWVYAGEKKKDEL